MAFKLHKGWENNIKINISLIMTIINQNYTKSNNYDGDEVNSVNSRRPHPDKSSSYSGECALSCSVVVICGARADLCQAAHTLHCLHTISSPADTGVQRQNPTPGPPALRTQIKFHAPCISVPEISAPGTKVFRMDTETFLCLPSTLSLNNCSLRLTPHMGPYIEIAGASGKHPRSSRHACRRTGLWGN